MQGDKFIEELKEFQKKIEFIINNENVITNENKEMFLKDLEKVRINLFENVKINNKYAKTKIDYLNNYYKAETNKEILKIFIPEVLPKYKNVSNYAYRNIMMNVAEACKKYSGMFNKNLTFVLIIIHEKQENMDIDNEYVKPIIDGLVLSQVISDDNINNMFYSVMGKSDTKKPYTEVYVMEAKYLINWIENLKNIF